MSEKEKGFFSNALEIGANMALLVDGAIGLYAVATGKIKLFVLAMTSLVAAYMVKNALQKKPA